MMLLSRSLRANATARSVASHLTAKLLSLPMYAYRLLVSPLMPNHCRYSPSCSAYAIEAMKTHGALHGSLLTLKRLARCHPWGGCGHDPVPQTKEQYYTPDAKRSGVFEIPVQARDVMEGKSL